MTKRTFFDANGLHKIYKIARIFMYILLNLVNPVKPHCT